MEALLIKMARACSSVEEFAEKLGWRKNIELFEEHVEERVEGILSLVRKNQAAQSAEEAKLKGDEAGFRASRLLFLKYSHQAMVAGLVLAPVTSGLLMAPPKSEPKETEPTAEPKAPKIPHRKLEKEKVSDKIKPIVKPGGRGREVVHPQAGDLKPFPSTDLAAPQNEESPMLQEILGYTGALYRKRKVILLRPCKGGPFGRLGRTVKVYRTVHNGLINHADLEKQPTAAWLVLDEIASQAGPDLQGTFTKASIIDAVTKILGEKFRTRVTNQFNILKTHHDHESKAKQCYSYMIENLRDDPQRRMQVRPRSRSETFQYFSDLRERRNHLRTSDPNGIIRHDVAESVYK